MTAAPRVSIGLPVYNGERYLGEALDSLLAQTFEDFELIISDNASTDRTGEIGRSYATRDKRVRYVRNDRNIGFAKNFQRAVELASGQYFKLHAADDLVAPEFLARCVEVLDREQHVVLVYPRARLINEFGAVIADYEDGLHLQSPQPSVRFRQLFERLRLCNAIHGVIRGSALRRTRLLGTFIGADVPFQGELILYGTFWEVPEFLFFRRFHPGASSAMLDQYLQGQGIDRIQAFFDPTSKSKVFMRMWRHLWEYWRSVARVPLDITEKLRLGYFLIRVAIWNRDKLWHELSAATRQLVR